MTKKADLLVIMAHPDDAELSCAGIIAAHIAAGYRVAMVDLTAGELGTRGSAVQRLKEAAAAAEILQVSERINLFLADGLFRVDYMALQAVVRVIRHFQPDIVITNALQDRHPDHPRAAQLVREACFYAGLPRMRTFDEQGQEQEAWRPVELFHVIQDEMLLPTLVVDVSDFWTIKRQAIAAFASQFYVSGTVQMPGEPETYISTPWFMERIEARGKELGHMIGADYGEGLVSGKALAVSNLFSILRNRR